MNETYGIQTYRKKPVHVQALRWSGANFIDMERFLETPRNGFFRGEALYLYAGDTAYMVIPGTWIIRAATGGYHPCREDAFADVYELATVDHHSI